RRGGRLPVEVRYARRAHQRTEEHAGGTTLREPYDPRSCRARICPQTPPGAATAVRRPERPRARRHQADRPRAAHPGDRRGVVAEPQDHRKIPQQPDAQARTQNGNGRGRLRHLARLPRALNRVYCGPMGEVLWTALRLGLTSFGGPIAHLGYFERTYVRKLQWLSSAEYVELVALCQSLPGPTSSQVGFLVGLRRAGWQGALAAWVGFTLPSALLMYAFAVLVKTLP